MIGPDDPARQARRQPSDELAAALAPVMADYARALRLAAALPPTDRRRCLAKCRARYRRLLGHAQGVAEWLADGEAAR